MQATEWLLSDNPVTIRRRVLWGDCDPANVVYTPRFADYVAAARDWFLRIGLGVMDRPAPGRTDPTFPMRALSFDFVSFLAADDLFDMAVTVTAVSSRTFSLLVTATHEDGRPCFTSTMTGVCLDTVQRKAVPLPDQMRARLLAHKPASCN